MMSKKLLSFALLLALAPAGEAAAAAAPVAGTDVMPAAGLDDGSAGAPAAASDDCSQGFFSRLGAAYRADAQPRISRS